jgi:hypothetical protein
MAHLQIARRQQRLHRLGQLQQAKQVACRAARAADGLCRLLVRHLEFGHQALQAMRLLERAEVLALDVLDQAHHRGRIVGNDPDQHRHLLEPGQARGTHAAFAGDDLVLPGVHGPDEDRLHHALAANALGELVKRSLVHADARLVLADAQADERQARWGRIGARFADLRAEQGLEAEAQALGFLRRHAPIVSRGGLCDGRAQPRARRCRAGKSTSRSK